MTDQVPKTGKSISEDGIATRETVREQVKEDLNVMTELSDLEGVSDW